MTTQNNNVATATNTFEVGYYNKYNVTIGQEVIIVNGNMDYGTVERSSIAKVTSTQIVDQSGRRFNRDTWKAFDGIGKDDNFKMVVNITDRERVALINSEIRAERRKQAAIRDRVARRDREDKAAAEAAEKAAKAAYLLTPEGILETRQNTEWFGAEYVVNVRPERGSFYRSAEILIVVNNRRVAEINVYQNTKSNWSEDQIHDTVTAIIDATREEMTRPRW